MNIDLFQMFLSFFYEKYFVSFFWVLFQVFNVFLVLFSFWVALYNSNRGLDFVGVKRVLLL